VRRALIAVGVAVTAVLTVDIAVVALHDKATPYDATQAVADFRRQASATPGPSQATSTASAAPTAAPTGSAGPSPTALPQQSAAAVPSGAPATARPANAAGKREVTEGVYRYTTSGHEQVDLLGGARHDYPAETAVTYRRGGCGDEDRWQPLKERYSSNTVCRGAHGLEARISIQRREFFNQSEEQVLTCAPGLVIVPDDPRAGQVFSGTCRSDDTVVRLVVRVREVTTMTVGGRRIGVVHVSVDGQMTGATRGSTQREEWFTPEGLLVRGTSTTETDRDTSAGVVHYSEVYELRLNSLDPQR